jgi:hypothetical protein
VARRHRTSLWLGIDRLVGLVSLRGNKPALEAIRVTMTPGTQTTNQSNTAASPPRETRTKSELLASIRFWLSIFIFGLIFSGLTALPLEHETNFLADFLGKYPVLPDGVVQWLTRVHAALHNNNVNFPFLAYGTDWLAFAHFVLAIAFVGPWRDPVRNKWVLQFGLIACIAVIPLALIAGPLRGIPLAWRLIDCSFGVFGAIPLLICLNRVKHLESLQQLVLTFSAADYHGGPPIASR